MRAFTAAFILGLLAIAHAQNVIILNRGCKTFDAAGACVECSTRYYRDDEGICQPVNPNCFTYDMSNGACTSCYPGFVPIEDTCLPEALFPSETPTDPFCNKFEGSKCVKCAFGYYFKEGLCTQADPNCRQFREENGQCLSCYPGFILQNNSCVVEPPGSPSENCRTFEDGICQECSFGYYFNRNRICTKIPDTCQSFNTDAERCLNCYEGYELNNQNECVESVAEAVDPGCNKFENGVCVTCSNGYYFDFQNKCRQIPPTCGDFDQVARICRQCYPGYQLNPLGRCFAVEAGAGDSGCSEFEDGKCVKCSYGFYFDKNDQCKQIPETCASYDTDLEICRNCYTGYTLDSNNVCVEGGNDSGCSQFENGFCVKCSVGYYFGRNGNCLIIPPTCANFNTATEICEACFPGYELGPFNRCVEKELEAGDSGCNQFKNGVCVKCSVGFYFRNNQCRIVPPTCSNFDIDFEICRGCYPGYALNNLNQCTEEEPSAIDPGCTEFENGVCVKCSFGFYFGRDSTCRLIPPSCSNFNVQSQICLSCYPGYELNDNQVCIEAEEAGGDPGCTEFEDGVCIQCSFGFYFGPNQRCRLIPPTCANFDISTEICRACYPGYALNPLGQCIEKPPEEGDAGCNQFQNGVCVRCSVGFYFPPGLRICRLIPPTCKNFNINSERCLECYSGYGLDAAGQCIEQDQGQIDPFCAEFEGDRCVNCSVGAYFNALRVCVPIDSTCKSFDTDRAICTECFVGYEIENGVCVESILGVSDPFCNEFVDGVCTVCSFRYFMGIDGRCREIDTSCKGYVQGTGRCTECFIGFKLQNDACVRDQEQLTDSYCAEFRDDLCIRCSTGAFFDPPSQKCRLVSPLCKTFNPENGYCLSCYPAFTLNREEGRCIEDLYFENQDPYCAQFIDDICMTCSKGYFLGNDGKCQASNPLCETFNLLTGNCITCYLGYKIEGTRCIEDPDTLTDFNCAEFNEGVCVRCSEGFFFDIAQRCRVVNPLCNGFNELTGACTGCYIGFVLQGDTCEVDENLQGGSSFCAEWKEGICLRCAPRAVFNNEGICQPVSEDCRTFNDFDGTCLTCYPGYKLEGGICVEADPEDGEGCAEYNQDGICIKCAFRRYLDNDQCLPIDDLCAEFDFNLRVCIGCYSGYSILSGKCEITKVQEGKEIENCFAYTPEGACLQCFERYWVYGGQCAEVSVFCKAYSKQNGLCTDCYTGFVLENGECVRN